MNLLACTYKSVYIDWIKITGSCRRVANYGTLSRIPDWEWWPLIDMSFSYDPIKTYGAIKTNKRSGKCKLGHLSLIKNLLIWLSILKGSLCTH